MIIYLFSVVGAGFRVGGGGGAQAVRSKGTLYLALHPHGDHAWGRWVGMSYDGLVISGWGSLARTQEQANQIVQDLIDEQPA